MHQISRVSLVTRVWTGQSRVGIEAGTGDLCLLKNVQSSFGAHSASSAVGTGLFPDHSPPSNAEVKNGRSYASAVTVYLHGMNRDNFYCTPNIFATSLEILTTLYHISGPGSVVGIATGYRLDGLGIEPRWGARFSAPVQTGPGAHPASFTMDTGSFLG